MDRYSSRSEVVRDALRRLEVEQNRNEALRLALEAGEQSGEPLPINNEQFKNEMYQKYVADNC